MKQDSAIYRLYSVCRFFTVRGDGSFSVWMSVRSAHKLQYKLYFFMFKYKKCAYKMMLYDVFYSVVPNGFDPACLECRL